MEIAVKKVTRMEGHGDLLLRAENGSLREVRFDVVEPIRFFETMLVGRWWDRVSEIASRICGICAVAHTLAAIKATEAAMGIEPSEQTLRLRKIALHGEVIQSNSLHAYYLAGPDYFGKPDVFHMIDDYPDLVRIALRVKALGNSLSETIGGRHVHPLALIVGGISKAPAREKLAALVPRLKQCKEDVLATIPLLKQVKLPDLERPTEYVAISHPTEYSFYEGEIKSSAAPNTFANADYLQVVHEFMTPTATAKHSHGVSGGPYMVGALARFNLNFDKLTPDAKQAAADLGMAPPVHRAYTITLAQVIECVHCCDDALRLIGEVLDSGLRHEDVRVRPRGGRGVGIVEAPRGMLIHDYTYDGRARLAAANQVIPTNQNLANINADLQAIAPGIIGEPVDDVRLKLEMLVRAYDPCISCSAHVLEMEPQNDAKEIGSRNSE